MKIIESFLTKNVYIHKIYVFQKDKIYFLLSTKGTTMAVNQDLFKEIQSKMISEDLLLKMIQNGMASLLEPTQEVNHSEKAGYFILDITKKCNFDCVYCMRSLTENTSMSFETLNNVLHFIEEYYYRNNLKGVSVQAWGGEPLIEKDKIFFIRDYFADRKIPCKIDVQTNASLITEQLAEKMFKAGIQVGISIDGNKVLHNQQRKKVGQLDSFDAVYAGIKNLQKYYDDRLGIICVLTKFNIDHIDEIIKYFYFDLKIRNVKFNIVRDNPNAVLDNLAPSDEQIDTFCKKVIENIQIYSHFTHPFNEANFTTKLENLISGEKKSICESRGCKGGVNMLAIDYKGDIFPCEVIDFPECKIGSVYDSIPIETQLVNSYKTNRYFKKRIEKECLDCPWKVYCEAGCTSRQLYSGKEGKDEFECRINKITYPLLVDYILEEENKRL